MTDGRKRISSVIAALGIAALGGTMLTTTPSYADPDIEDVQSRVDRLYHEAEQASERYNVVREDLADNRSRLKSLRADLARKQDKVDAARDQVASTVVAQSQGQAISSTSQLLVSEDPDEFISQFATVSAYNDQQGQMMADYATEAEQLETRKDAKQSKVATIAEAEDDLAKEKAEIDEKAGAAKEMLDELEAEERARLEAAQAPSRSGGRVAVGDVSGSGGAAVEFALAQVGDSYVYGAAGLDAWDCSGLTMGGWAAAGVSLPHQSGMQMSQGMPVSISALQPGDIVAYYSPISHVGMYIGNGQLVHAANPSSPVEVVPVDSMPISGAVRPG